VDKALSQEQAEQLAEMYDGMALRCIAVKSDDPRVLYDEES
jgi:hypothetical protein